ncbi:MAG: hypothetical protein HC842_05135 [Cytophagales bacterium]|nr:hypothetical protein [Cytophagales bacterium]
MRRQFIGEQLGLSEAQAEKFWPIYEDYLAQREDAHRQKKILRMEAQMNDLSDAKAKELLDKHLELQHREIKREEEFMQRFRQVITNVQVIKLVSLEHEFRRKLLQHYKERGGHGEHSHTE